jgi:phage-related protein
MPIILPTSFLDAIEKPHATSQLIWLAEIELARPYVSGFTTVPSTVLRVCNYHQAITWPVSSPLHESWDPYPFTFSPIEQNQEGDLPQVELSVDNTARLLMRYLHAGDGLEGNYARLWLVPEGGLGIAYPNHEYRRWDLQVAGAYATDEAVSFRLERANFFERTSPQDRFVARQCRWDFGSPECGYVINAVAAFTSCPRTKSACTARGQDHATRGLPVLHPRRFGGFPGIPRQQ